MKDHRIRLAISLLIVPALVGCSVIADGTKTPEQGDQMPTAYAGITTIGLALEVGKAIENNDSQLAQQALDSLLVQALGWASQAPPDIQAEKSFKKGRDRLAAMVKARWLKDPPQYLDLQLEQYLDSLCKDIPDCLQGDIKQKSTGEQFSHHPDLAQ